MTLYLDDYCRCINGDLEYFCEYLENGEWDYGFLSRIIYRLSKRDIDCLDIILDHPDDTLAGYINESMRDNNIPNKSITPAMKKLRRYMNPIDHYNKLPICLIKNNSKFDIELLALINNKYIHYLKNYIDKYAHALYISEDTFASGPKYIPNFLDLPFIKRYIQNTIQVDSTTIKLFLIYFPYYMYLGIMNDFYYVPHMYKTNNFIFDW